MEFSHDTVDSFSGSKAFCAEAHSNDRWDPESVVLAKCVGGYHQRWEAFGVDTCSRNMHKFSEEDIMVVLNEDKSLCIESLYNEDFVGLGLKPCDATNLRQIWAFEEGHWAPKGAPGLCVELGDDMVSHVFVDFSGGAEHSSQYYSSRERSHTSFYIIRRSISLYKNAERISCRKHGYTIRTTSLLRH